MVAAAGDVAEPMDEADADISSLPSQVEVKSCSFLKPDSHGWLAWFPAQDRNQA